MKRRYITLLLFANLVVGGYAQEPIDENTSFCNKLAAAAIELTKNRVEYDASYFTIGYPNGDIPENLGVNADVIIRAYRKVGVDLQQEVHEDMSANWDLYPNELWQQKEPDTNIDHRRVPNLQTFFSRKGEVLPIDQENSTYKAGEIVVWKLNNSKLHIGIVTDQKSPYGTPLVVHISNSGLRLQNVLFHFDIVAHYRYCVN